MGQSNVGEQWYRTVQRDAVLKVWQAHLCGNGKRGVPWSMNRATVASNHHSMYECRQPSALGVGGGEEEPPESPVFGSCIGFLRRKNKAADGLSLETVEAAPIQAWKTHLWGAWGVGGALSGSTPTASKRLPGSRHFWPTNRGPSGSLGRVTATYVKMSRGADNFIGGGGAQNIPAGSFCGPISSVFFSHNMPFSHRSPLSRPDPRFAGAPCALRLRRPSQTVETTAPASSS